MHRPENTQGNGQEPKYSWGAIAVMAILAAALLGLALCLGAETGPDCLKQGLKLC